jgi:hypothetical protein
MSVLHEFKDSYFGYMCDVKQVTFITYL